MPISKRGGDGLAVASRDHGQGREDGDIAAVLDVVGRVYEQVVDTLERVGLTYRGYQVLRHLQHVGEIRIDEVEKLLRGPGPGAPEVVEGLIEAGMVRRSDAVGPPTSVVLTPLGSACARRGVAGLSAVERDFAARLDRPDREGLERLLERVAR